MDLPLRTSSSSNSHSGSRENPEIRISDITPTPKKRIKVDVKIDIKDEYQFRDFVPNKNLPRRATQNVINIPKRKLITKNKSFLLTN